MFRRNKTVVAAFALGILAGVLLAAWWVSRPAPVEHSMPRAVRGGLPSPDTPRQQPRVKHTPPLWAQPHLTDKWTSLPAVSEVVPPQAVVVIGIDTLRADHLSTYGYERPTSPTLDRLVREGAIVFENAYSASTWTLPSMTSIFTSLWTTQHGVNTRHDRLDPTIPTVAGAFAAQGWLSAAFITHIYVSSLFGLDSGFQEFRELSIDWNYGEGNQLHADEVNEYVEPWLSQHTQQRFLLYVHYFDPHWNYDPPPPFNTRFIDPAYQGPPLDGAAYLLRNRKLDQPLSGENLRHVEGLYDGEIAFTDQQLGELFDTMQQLGLWDRTLVAVVADHGEGFMEHGETGHPDDLYQEITHVPLILKLPGHRPAGWRQRIPERVRALDLGPTVLQLAGLEVPDTFAGASLVPLMKHKGEDRPVLAASIGDRESVTALIFDRWKLIHHGALRHDPPDTSRDELYDWSSDRGDAHDISAAHPEQRRRMLELLRTWIDTKARPLRPAHQAPPVKLTAEQKRYLEALGYL